MRWILSMLALLTISLAGCAGETPPAPGGGGGGPQMFLQGGNDVTVAEDQYLSVTLDAPGGIWRLDVEALVPSGPAIDIYTLNPTNYQQFEAGNAFVYHGCSVEGVKAHTASCNLEGGLWYLVFDNSNRGATSPPWNGVDDFARVQYTAEGWR